MFTYGNICKEQFCNFCSSSLSAAGNRPSDILTEVDFDNCTAGLAEDFFRNCYYFGDNSQEDSHNLNIVVDIDYHIDRIAPHKLEAAAYWGKEMDDKDFHGSVPDFLDPLTMNSFEDLDNSNEEDTLIRLGDFARNREMVASAGQAPQRQEHFLELSLILLCCQKYRRALQFVCKDLASFRFVLCCSCSAWNRFAG